MPDPLAEIVSLLQPGALRSKIATGAGHWSVHREATGKPFYCILLEGTSRLAVAGHTPLDLEAGDFVLIPSGLDFQMGGTVTEPSAHDPFTVTYHGEETRHGDPHAPASARMLIGHFSFESPDSALLVSLLPQLVHVRGDDRLAALVKLVGDEAGADRPARGVVLGRLLEVLLIEALRRDAGMSAPPGLLKGLSDPQLAAAIRSIHSAPARRWTVNDLAREAALSRSGFFDRFHKAVGITPMDYVLSWRMAQAKRLLRLQTASIAEIAERVGYGSGSTFSVAFSRYAGMTPTQYASAS